MRFRVAKLDLRDVGDLEVRQELRADLLAARAVVRDVLPEKREARAAEHQQRDDEDEELLAVHCALSPVGYAVGAPRPRCGGAARARGTSPSSATSSGTSPMLTTLVQNSSCSLSTRRFLRTSFSSTRVSADFLRKLSISACCSGVRIVLVAGRARLAFLQLLQLLLRLLQAVLELLDLAEILLLRLGFHLLDHGQRTRERRAAAQAHEVLVARELLDETLREREVAVARHDQLLAEHLLHFDRGAVGEQVDVGDEHDLVLRGGFAQVLARPGRLGASFSPGRTIGAGGPFGNAVLNLPERRMRERHTPRPKAGSRASRARPRASR